MTKQDIKIINKLLELKFNNLKTIKGNDYWISCND